MEIKEGGYNRLTLNYEGQVENSQILLVAGAGEGKSLATEKIIEEYYNSGYLIISLNDVKHEVETGFAMFQPEKEYHVNKLIREGQAKKIKGKVQLPSPKPVKLYHPFSYKIPRTKLPDINFFTYSLQELRREELSMLLETHYDTESLRLIMNALSSMPDNSNMYDILHYMKERLRKKTKKVAGKPVTMPDPENFWLDVPTAGTSKNIGEISSFFSPFKKHPFLQPKNHFLNLDFKELLKDQKHYHVLLGKWLDDGKLESFNSMLFFDRIIDYKDYHRYPVCFLISEVGRLVPFKSEGYKQFIAEALRDKIITIRGVGKGCASVMDTQVWTDVDEKVREKTPEKFIGRLSGMGDIEKISKALKYKREITEEMSKLQKNNFLWVGEEDTPMTFLFPGHMHAEAEYNFERMYKKKCPEKMKKYLDIMNMVKKIEEQVSKKWEMKIKKEKKGVVKEIKIEEKEKEQKQKVYKELEEIKDKRKTEVLTKKEKMMQECYELHKEDPKKWTNRKIGQKLNIHHQTVGNYIELMMKKEIEEKICEECGAKMILRTGKHGQFFGCSNYPKCKHSESISG